MTEVLEKLRLLDRAGLEALATDVDRELLEPGSDLVFARWERADLHLLHRWLLHRASEFGQRAA